MNLNMNYGQVVRGPGQASRAGRSSGVIDLKCMVKVINAALVLRAGRAPDGQVRLTWASLIGPSRTSNGLQTARLRWLQLLRPSAPPASLPQPRILSAHIVVTRFTDLVAGHVLQQSRVALFLYIVQETDQCRWGTSTLRELHPRWRYLDT
jgi:hypothetical protein